MKLHRLKIWGIFFNAVINGKKLFEIRKMDRDFQVGDEILLQEFNHQQNAYTGRECMVRISYIYKSNDYLREGYGVLAIRLITDDTEDLIYSHRKDDMLKSVSDLSERCRMLQAQVESDRYFLLHLRAKMDKIIPMIKDYDKKQIVEKFCQVLYMRENDALSKVPNMADQHTDLL